MVPCGCELPGTSKSMWLANQDMTLALKHFIKIRVPHTISDQPDG